MDNFCETMSDCREHRGPSLSQAGFRPSEWLGRTMMASGTFLLPALAVASCVLIYSPVALAQAYAEDFSPRTTPSHRCERDRVIPSGGKWGNRSCNRTNHVDFPEYGGDYRCPGIPSNLSTGPEWLIEPPLDTSTTYCAGAVDPVDPSNCVLRVAWEPYCFAAGGYRTELSEQYDAPLDENFYVDDLGHEEGEPPWRGLRGSDDTSLSYRFYVHPSTVDMMENLPL